MDSNNMNNTNANPYQQAPQGTFQQAPQANYQQTAYQQAPQANPYANPYAQQAPVINNYMNQIPAEYKPISMWGYFGYELLFAIPVIGFIFLIIFAIGASNKNVKNFARSYFCLFIIMLILGIILFATGFLGSALYYYF